MYLLFINLFFLLTTTDKKRFGLPKSEHIVGRDRIGELYAKGKKIAEPPLLLVYKPTDMAGCACVMFSVPKRQFKYATDRNRYKRLMREAYRLNKEIIANALQGKSFGIDLSLVATQNTPSNFASTSQHIIKLLNSLSSKIDEIHI